MTKPHMASLVFSALFVSLTLVFALFLCATQSYAQSYLTDLSATLNTNIISEPAQLSIRFTLPTNALPIRNIDYIQVYLPDFSNISPPSLVTGGYAGIPVYSVSGQYSQVTGITVLPGQSIFIEGINLTNPASPDLFQVIVMVTSDAAATQVRSIGNTIALRNFSGAVSVSATIPNLFGNLLITGYTAPQSFIIFTEGNAVIGTTVAEDNGYFSRYFSGLQPTTHSITFYGVDSANRSTSPINLEVYTPRQQLITISNQILSPTIELLSNLINQGDDLVASGSAVPLSDLTLFTDSPLRTYYASVSATGSWTYSITDTLSYILGDYRIYGLTLTGSALQSLLSPSIPFSITSTLVGGTTCGDISQGDLNCDGNIDLTDFSILMYYWGTANAAADINEDGLVNLTDFSVLMYWWGT